MVNNAVRTRWGLWTMSPSHGGDMAPSLRSYCMGPFFYGAAENDGVPSDGRQPLGGHREASHAKEEAVIADACQWRGRPSL